jgi:hypothetical protein
VASEAVHCPTMSSPSTRANIPANFMSISGSCLYARYYGILLTENTT